MNEQTAFWSCAITQADIGLSRVAARAEVEEAVSRTCEAAIHALSNPLKSAVHYALTGGGKRLRGMLVLASYRAAGGVGDASGLAAAVEIMHTYSLVHDDLPCMDDDDMRRGRPSTHRVYGVQVATAAGAIMVPIAAQAAYRAACLLRLPDDACCTIVKVLMQGAGAGGMIGGQLLDLKGEGKDLSRGDLDAIHSAKTGALIASAVTIGGIAASVSNTALDALGSYGSSIGLAFQIMDDVLDVTASTDQLGKIAGRDIALGKSTYPALLGVDGAIERANGLIEEARAGLSAQNLLSPELDGLARFIVSRSH